MERYYNMYDIFAFAYLNDHKIIIASGRKHRWKMRTLQMLQEGSGGYDFWTDFYFRDDDDNRRDDVVKEEMYEQMLKDGYDPKLVFDDRQQVVDMWRSKGIRVCQVAVGDF